MGSVLSFQSSQLRIAHFFLRRIGIAYTIDPVYEAEVRDYLGETPFLHIYRAFLISVSIVTSDYREKVKNSLEILTFVDVNMNITRTGIPWKPWIFMA